MPMHEKPPEKDPPHSLGGYVWRAFRNAQRRRPVSFYLLLATPVVLLLGFHMYRYREDPYRFAMVLALQFIFFGIVLFRAVIDIFEITRKNLREGRENYQHTLGDEEFLRELSRRVRNELQDIEDAENGGSGTTDKEDT